MRLSLILCSRNDAYQGNSRWRLETTLNSLGEQIRTLARTRDVEVLVADWGSDVPLREVLALEPAAAEIVSFVTIPPAVARAREGDSPFPEVLALNAAARRARGEFIGRIDQDTVVGSRFFRWFFDAAAARVEDRDTTLWFANRRDIPYRFAVRCLERGQVARFVRWFGRVLPVQRENRWFANDFWSGSVGIWLAHRSRWEECRGYDERLIYYNWMETDMIRRLRQSYAIANLGALTGYDFYHLEHHHARVAGAARTHARKNPDIDRSSRSPILRPNGHAWGLADCELAVERGTRVAAPRARPGLASLRDLAAFAGVMAVLVCEIAVDRIVLGFQHLAAVTRRRLDAAARGVSGQPVTLWPGTLWRMWHGRKANRAR